jgi:uncharacterized membrane protein YeaQ/YmgE (transglycosylase-associated protein family)
MEDLVNLLWFLIVGLVAGWLARTLVRGSRYGAIGDLIVGVIGAFVGGMVFSEAGVAGGGVFGSILVATVGAIVLIFMVRMVKPT